MANTAPDYAVQNKTSLLDDILGTQLATIPQIRNSALKHGGGLVTRMAAVSMKQLYRSQYS
jgi:hypothetical protein